MRIEFIAAKRASVARKLAPWAAIVVKVCGGYKAFESWSDYQVWRNQR